MIDFVKYELINTRPEILECNSLLDFHNKVNLSTGEMGTYINAFYKGLEFRIYDATIKTPYRRITVEGSLHKYWNSGAHNFNDFGIMQVVEVVNDLKRCFNIFQENCVLKCLEIGVNIEPPYKTKTILNQCLLHKTDRFKWVYTNDEGNYIQTKHQRHFIKIYDKKTHYKNKGFTIDNEILRIEKKYTKMKYLNDKGIYTLKDLLNYGLHNFQPELLKDWENVLIYDKSILEKTKYKDRYSNVVFWQELKRDNFKYHRNNLNKILSKHPENIKNQIAILIKNKCEFLNTKTTQINPLHIRLIRVVSTSQKQDENRRLCVVTKLNISMQKEDSILLSHTGLRYYFKTDKKIFNEVKNKYLSGNWIDSEHETQIKEIAHNIRNTNSNQTIRQRKLYTKNQMRLFNIN
ncbi:hypothetical protein ACFFU9_07910 [Mariniflexile ostreae]|uniref:Phage replication initiation protein n=1 Tax=Mariniflexile ostreae TaxID=1520892 RepID=A0ABV5FB34_9FLAO